MNRVLFAPVFLAMTLLCVAAPASAHVGNPIVLIMFVPGLLVAIPLVAIPAVLGHVLLSGLGVPVSWRGTAGVILLGALYLTVVVYEALGLMPG